MYLMKASSISAEAALVFPSGPESGKCSYERPTRGTVCGTMRGADAGCLAISYQSLFEPETRSVLAPAPADRIVANNPDKEN